MTSKPSVSTDAFLFFDLEKRYEELRQLSDAQSTRGSLTTKLLAQLKIVLPIHDVVQLFETHATKSLEKIAKNLHHSKSLAKLRDTLLPKLLSGELRIPDAEKLVARSL